MHLFTFPSALQNYSNSTDQAINNTSSDDELDISALDAFCHLVKNEPELSTAATRFLAGKIQSQNVKESLFALDALEGNRNGISSDQQFIELSKLLIRRMHGHTRLQFSNGGEQI